MIELPFRKFKIIGKWLVAVIALTCVTYPIIVLPMSDPKPYQELQKINRKDIIQENIQPGNMKVWSDPFDRLEKKGRTEMKQDVFFK